MTHLEGRSGPQGTYYALNPRESDDKVNNRSDSGDGSEEEAAERTPSLQQLFAARLEKQEAEQVERDELARYEAYVRAHCGPA